MNLSDLNGRDQYPPYGSVLVSVESADVAKFRGHDREMSTRGLAVVSFALWPAPSVYFFPLRKNVLQELSVLSYLS